MLVIALALAQANGAAATGASVARPAEVLYLGSSAHASGYVDTNWRTDVELHNAGRTTATINVDMLLHASDNTGPTSVQLQLGPGQCRRLSDVLMSSFGVEGKAALRISTDASTVLATNRTYNLLGEGNGLGLAAGATFGQYIAARRANEGIAGGETGRLIQLTHDASARTNLGLVNVSGVTVDVEVDLHLSDGTKLGTVPVRLMPYEYRQLTRVFENVTSSAVVDGYAVVRTLTDGGRVLGQASVVDNLTGDPVFVPAERTPSPSAGGQPLWIVAAAHAGGVGGTNWRTDLEVHNPNDTTATYTVELLPHAIDNSSPRSTTLTLGPGESVRHVDVLQTLFGFEGIAALRIIPENRPLLVTSRTYNLLGSGNPLGLPAGATFGQFIPPAEEGEAIGVDEEGRLIHLSQAATDTSGFRTNLILVNATAAPLTVEVDLHESASSRLGTLTVDLAPREYRQLNKVFATVTSDAVEDAFVVVRTRTHNGAFFALASVVDNLTGDPVGMMAATVRSEGADGLIGTTETIMGFLGGQGLEGPVTLPELVSVIADEGVDGLLDGIESSLGNGVMTRSSTGAVLDFGSGTTIGGQVLAGEVELTFSDIVLGGGVVQGTVTELHRGYTVDGVAPALKQLTVELDLATRSDGSVHGTMALNGSSEEATASSLAAGGTTLSGLVDIDSAICLYYPVGGSVTLSLPDGEIATVRFGPDCDGGFDSEVTLAWDWTYSFQNPSTPGAMDHVVYTSNAEITDDYYAVYWTPVVGGTTFVSRSQPGDTPPAVIRYHFSFDRPIESAYLDTDTPTFWFSYSRGHNYVLGSKDGADWVVIQETASPSEEGGPARNGHFMGELPASLMGGTELWLQAELYCWGSLAPQGYTNTAQHSRYPKDAPRTTFDLKVKYAGR